MNNMIIQYQYQLVQGYDACESTPSSRGLECSSSVSVQIKSPKFTVFGKKLPRRKTVYQFSPLRQKLTYIRLKYSVRTAQ